MKGLYFLIVVLVIASGYFSYREGYLAGVHPLLDPSAKIVVTREGEDRFVEVTEENEEGVVSEVAQAAEKEEVAPVTEENPRAEPQMSEKERARMERAEQTRLAREAREAEQAAATAAREAEFAARKEHNDLVNREIGDLERKLSELQSQLRGTQNKMSGQEAVWRDERIKTREAEKQQLRQAAQAYEAQLRAQMDLVFQQTREKRRELK